MAWSAWNNALANTGQIISGAITRNRETELKQLQEKQKKEQEDKAIQLRLEALKGIINQDSIANKLPEAIGDVRIQKQFIPKPSDNPKNQAILDLFASKDLSASQAIDLIKPKEEKGKEINWKNVVDPVTGNVTSYDPKNPSNFKVDNIPSLKQEFKKVVPKKEPVRAIDEKIINKDGYVGKEITYSDGSTRQTVSTKEWTTKVNDRKVLSPDAKKIMESDWTVFNNLQTQLDQLSKNGFIVTGEDEFGAPVVKKANDPVTYVNNKGETVEGTYNDYLVTQKTKTQNDYVSKIKSSLSQNAEKWYQTIYNMGETPGNPDPQDYWENLNNAYSSGAFDTSGTKEIEQDEDYTLQILFELFRATYGFDPIKRYGNAGI